MISDEGGGSKPPEVRSRNFAKWFPLVTAVLALTGVGIGAGLQFLSSRALASQKLLLDTRVQSYTDFLQAQALYLKAHESGDSAQLRSANQKIRDAAFRISAFSSGAVVRAIGDFIESSGKRPPCEAEAGNKDLAMYQAIRSELLGGARAQAISDRTLAMVLFGCTMPATPA